MLSEPPEAAPKIATISDVALSWHAGGGFEQAAACSDLSSTSMKTKN
tara:strand:+ start:135 stop:275 length:141 start_codon:yes stop_codon:yes gene_type:complete